MLTGVSHEHLGERSSVMMRSLSSHMLQRENRFFSGIGCADLPFSSATPESGARCCCIICCPKHRRQNRRAASSMLFTQGSFHIVPCDPLCDM